MAYSETLANRLRQSLTDVPRVKEQKMFGGLAFMVNAKMCVAAGPDRIMCRIDPGMHDMLVQRKGCSTVVMGGRMYRGYVYVNQEALRTRTGLGYWVKLALAFNKTLTKTPKKKRDSRG